MRIVVVVWLAVAATAAHADPIIGISPTPIGFGGIAPNNGGAIGVKQLGYFFVQNTGDAPLVVSDLTLTAPSAIAFDDACTTQTCTGPFTIAPGGNREFRVACTPTAAGYLNGTLSINSNATSGTSTAGVSCIANHPPVIQVMPGSLDFGISHSCNVGDLCGPTCATQPLTQTLTITNAAPDPSDLTFHISPPLPSSTIFDEWSIVGDCTQSLKCSLGPGQSHTVQYTFGPHGGQPQLYTTPLSITSNYPGVAPVSVPFYAEGGWGQLSFDTPSNLGIVAPGQTLMANLTVRNTGRSCLRFAPPVVADPEIALVGSQPSSITLASGATHTFTLSCTPDADGASTILDFDVAFENVDMTSYTVFCEAGTFGRTVSPMAHAFGAVALPASPSRSFDLQNTGNLALVVDAIAGTGDFSVSNLPLSTNIAPGTTHTFSIETTPTALGESASTITIGFDGAADLVIPVDALATDPALVVSSYEVAHAPLDVDVDPRTQMITLQNTTASPIAIANCAIAGDPELTIATACPFTIAGNSTVMFGVRFAPTAEAQSTAAITLTGTGFATGALRLSASGTGLDQHVALSAMSTSFGDTVRRPLQAPTRDITIENTDATRPLVLSSFAFDHPSFKLIPAPEELTLPPGATYTFTLRFAPTAYGDITGHFTIGNTDDPAIARIALTGRGIERPVEVGPRTIDLGEVDANIPTRLGGNAITLRNVSPTATIAISRVSLGGDNVFTILGPDRPTLAPNEIATLDLELVAPVAGVYATTISIYLDNDVEPHAQIAVTATVIPATASGGCCDGGSGARTSVLVAFVACWLLRRRRGRASSTAFAR